MQSRRMNGLPKDCQLANLFFNSPFYLDLLFQIGLGRRSRLHSPRPVLAMKWTGYRTGVIASLRGDLVVLGVSDLIDCQLLSVHLFQDQL